MAGSPSACPIRRRVGLGIEAGVKVLGDGEGIGLNRVVQLGCAPRRTEVFAPPTGDPPRRTDLRLDSARTSGFTRRESSPARWHVKVLSGRGRPPT